MEETKLMIGWYSQKQQNLRHNDPDMKYPYLYYEKINGEIVQVSGVLNSETEKSLWDDAVYLGPLKRFYKATNEPIKTGFLDNPQ